MRISLRFSRINTGLDLQGTPECVKYAVCLYVQKVSQRREKGYIQYPTCEAFYARSRIIL